jgi:thiol-disulfide isomerase/thioredoxin
VRSPVRALAMLTGLVLLLLGGLLATAPSSVAASSLTADRAPDGVELILFWGDGCPHCEAERAWLEQAREEYPDLRVTEHEVWYDAGNRELMLEMGDELGFEASGVPTTIVGEQVWIGFSDSIRKEIEQAVVDAGAEGAPEGRPPTAGTTIDLPLVGEVALDGSSLVVSTLIIGFVDGVNPCSLWVIAVLLAIVVRTGSRRRVLAIGATFLLVTAAMYAVYMAGIYSAMSVVGHLGAVQVVVAVMAGVLGVVSVKDYFAFKKGISFTIPDSAKPRVYQRMRAAAAHHDLVPALGATAVLAVGVSLLETPCTAGFPMLWTGMLAANEVSTPEAVALFGVYMVPFLVDELIVFGLAVVTLRATKMQERHGRVLKLVAGTTMLALAGTVLLRPETMADPLAALVVFSSAFAVAGLVHLATTTWSRRQRRQGAGRPSSHQPKERVSQGSTR